MAREDSYYWVVPSGTLSPEMASELVAVSNCHRLTAAQIDAIANGRPIEGGPRYSLDGSRLILRHDPAAPPGPNGPPAPDQLELLDALSVNGRLTHDEIRGHLDAHRDDWTPPTED